MSALSTVRTTDAGIVRVAAASDVGVIGETLASAFYADPVFRWCYPDDAHRLAILPAFFELFADAFLPHGESYVTEDGAAAALWLPPGTIRAMPDADAEVFGARLAELSGPHADRLFEASEVMDAHHPSGSFYYLQFLGVQAAAQGQGLGSKLLRHVLRQADAQGVRAYLEATTPDNRRLYERHGFEATEPLPIPGCPPMWPMWREPGASRTD